MLKVFFNENGYYVAGEGIEITRRCSPALTDKGDRIFQPTHHEYRICFLALQELCNIGVRDDVIVYGSSRIVDELNGLIRPLDETCDRWAKLINRSLIPYIKAVVFFRKKSIGDIQSNIDRGQSKLMTPIDEQTAERIATETVKSKIEYKRKAISKLRTKWFNHEQH